MQIKKYIIASLFLVALSCSYFIFNNNSKITDVIADNLRLDDQEATIRAIKKLYQLQLTLLLWINKLLLL